MLEKLKKYGFSSHEWFSSYLSSRYQSVRVGNTISLPKRIKCGIPQGSVLGPTLFNLYINDLTTLNLNSKMLIYADDVVLYTSGTCTDTILDKMQSDINQIFEWSLGNRLLASPTKTKMMMIGRPRRLSNLPKLR